MRKEIEQRPVDTKVLRENFRRGLERNMNKLMSEGYIPMGGISTHMNTHTRPVLGIDSQEYTQTMVKYADFEVWIKESDEDRSAFNDEQTRQSLTSQFENLKKSIVKDIQAIKKLQESLEKSKESETPRKKSFFKNIKYSINTSLENNRKKRLLEVEESVAAKKSRFRELKEQINTLDDLLAKYYKKNPSVTKDILLNSR